MVTKEVVINNQVGLHARPATFFIQKANEFKSSIWIEKEDRRVNAKSLLGVLSLGIVKGTAVKARIKTSAIIGATEHKVSFDFFKMFNTRILHQNLYLYLLFQFPLPLKGIPLQAFL